VIYYIKKNENAINNANNYDTKMTENQLNDDILKGYRGKKTRIFL